MLESKKFFLKNTYSLPSKPEQEAVIINVYQTEKTEHNTNIINLIEIKYKDESLHFATRDGDSYQSWVERINKKDFLNSLELGSAYDDIYRHDSESD
jgi:hypothetical protein